MLAAAASYVAQYKQLIWEQLSTFNVSRHAGTDVGGRLATEPTVCPRRLFVFKSEEVCLSVDLRVVKSDVA